MPPRRRELKRAAERARFAAEGPKPLNKFFAATLTPPPPETPNVKNGRFMSELAGIRSVRAKEDMKIRQVWFCRPIHAIPSAPIYIGTGPEWAGLTVSTGAGTVVVCKGALKLQVPLENVLAYEVDPSET